jgi:hypothetical protein
MTFASKNHTVKTAIFCAIVSLLVATSVTGSGLKKEWTRIFGSPYNDQVTSVRTTVRGDEHAEVVVVGYSNGEIAGQVNHGQNDMFLTEWSDDGTMEWTRMVGTPVSDRALDVEVYYGDDDERIYVTGSTYGDFPGQPNAGGSDAVLVCCNSTGAVVYVRVFGSPANDEAVAVAVDALFSQICVAGNTSSGFNGQVSYGLVDPFVCAFDTTTGTDLWTSIFGSDEYDFCGDVCAEADGLYCVGGTEGDLGGQVNSGSEDIFVSFLTHQYGVCEWVALWGSAAAEAGFGTKVNTCYYPPLNTFDEQTNSLDCVYIAAYTFGEFGGQTNAGSEDTCLMMLSADGSPQWTRIWGSARTDEGYDLAVDQNGDAYVTGFTYGEFDGQTNTGSKDAFLTWFTADGTRRESCIWGSTTHDEAKGVAVDDHGAIYVVGTTLGAFDGQTNLGSYDVFITKFLNVAPSIYITTSPYIVELPDETASIAGTNNEHIAVNSMLWWENTSTAGVGGKVLADVSRAWSITGIPLVEELNTITVAGSNIYGDIGSDSIVIELVPEISLGLSLLGTVALVAAAGRRGFYI